MSRKITFSEGEYYHIYNRGVERREIFLDAQDQERFISLLYLCNMASVVNVQEMRRDEVTLSNIFLKNNIEVIPSPLVAIGAYCLMPNHFHILFKEVQEGGISRFMHKFLTAYSMYFNAKYKRTGRLFEGPFKAQHADSDKYLKYLHAYIHLNPMKLFDTTWKTRTSPWSKDAEDFLRAYTSSSYSDYAEGGRPQGKILNKKVFPGYFSTKKDFKQFTHEWLVIKNEFPNFKNPKG